MWEETTAEVNEEESRTELVQRMVVASEGLSQVSDAETASFRVADAYRSRYPLHFPTRNHRLRYEICLGAARPDAHHVVARLVDQYGLNGSFLRAFLVHPGHPYPLYLFWRRLHRNVRS